MNDYHLKFADEAEAEAVLFDVSEEPVYGPSETEFDEKSEYTYSFKVNGDSYEFTTTEEIAKEDLLETCRTVFYGTPDAPLTDDKFTYIRLASSDTIRTPKTVQTGTAKVKRPRYTAVDELGVIYKATGKKLKTDEGEAEEMAALPGWHVNVRHKEEAPELAPHQVFPKTPSRVWL